MSRKTSNSSTGGAQLFSPSLLADPFDFYQEALRDRPVQPTDDEGVWLVVGADEISEICARPQDFSNDISVLIAGQFHTESDVAAVVARGWPQQRVLLMSDPPDHRRFRRLVGLAFSAPRVNAIEKDIRAFSRRLLDDVERGQAWDFVADYAIPLPVAVIAQQLGLPTEMRYKVRHWSDAFTDQLGGMIDKSRAIECAEIVVEFQLAMKQQIDRRRAKAHDDLLADLVSASADGDDPLTDGELLSIIQQLLVAGNETSTSAIAEGLKLLITHPEQMQRLRTDPSLTGNAVEEILRLASPVAGSWRIVTHDLDFHGHRMKQGDRVMIRFAAASRDPSRFAEPDAFDVTRETAKRHFAFGRGIHTCLGNLLARKELSVALEHLLARFENIAFAEPENALTYVDNVMLRGLRRLPVVAY